MLRMMEPDLYVLTTWTKIKEITRSSPKKEPMVLARDPFAITVSKVSGRKYGSLV